MVLTPWLSCFIGGVYRENHWPAASLTNFIRNGVSSNKGILIADIYICTTVYINLKNIPPREPRGIETNFIRNGVSSNKGVLIADIYICTTVYKFKEHPPFPEGTPGYRNRT